MKINRNNYEHYFLLFADEELASGEKDMVVLFVKENPDLEEEFLMLQQSVVRPDKNITLEDKSFLLKQEQNFISEKNYEEAFVLYNDGELSGEEKRQTEEFVAQHPALQNEFLVWQKVKLPADQSIVFPDKRSLLKQEGRGKVITLNLRRILTAAVITGFGLWAGINLLTDVKKTTPSIAVKPANEVTSPKITQPDPGSVHVKGDEIKSSTLKQIAAKTGQSSPVQTNPIKHTDNNFALKHNNKKEKVPNAITIKAPAPGQNEIVDKGLTTDKKPATTDVAINEIKKPGQQTKELVTEKVINQPATENFALATSFKADEKNDNYAFYNISEEEFRKSKIGGFLKKIKRVIERKSPFNHNNEKAEMAVN